MSKILLLVEGEDTEKRLLKHFYKLYGKDQIEIISYRTEVYTFYKKLKRYMKQNDLDYSNIDLSMFLYEDSERIELGDKFNQMDFTDRILVFDFDPHATTYKKEILIELMINFSDSTESGKLYLNYPMVESFKDMESLGDKNFMNSTFPKSKLAKRGYKQHINEQARKNKINNINKISKDIARKLIDLHRQKLEYITKLPASNSEKYLQLCQSQCKKLSEEHLMWIINTSILHLYDEYGPLN